MVTLMRLIPTVIPMTVSIIPYPPRLWLDAADASRVVHTDGDLTRWKNRVSNQHDAVLINGNVKVLSDGIGGSYRRLTPPTALFPFWIAM